MLIFSFPFSEISFKQVIGFFGFFFFFTNNNNNKKEEVKQPHLDFHQFCIFLSEVIDLKPDLMEEYLSNRKKTLKN